VRNLRKNGKRISKRFSSVWKLAIPIALILLSLNIQTCKKPDPVLYPVDLNKVTVRKLENGNWEVKEGMVYDYLRLLAENKILKATIKELGK